MLKLLTEWNDAPGVRDPALAATWARLEIKWETPAESRWLSQLIRSTTNGVDRGVYGSLLPLAEWIVENWWFLLHETCRVPDFISGRFLAHDPQQRDWLQRHNLLAARNGGALPDVTIFRDGESVALKWMPDPKSDENALPVRFVDEGSARISPDDVERELHRFVEAVLERLPNADHDSVVRLQTNWNAICESRQTEADLCALSAAMGLDPYDDDQLTDEIAEVIQSRLCKLSPRLQHDLVDVADRESIVADLDWLDGASSEIELDGDSSVAPPETSSAHQHGYHLAAVARDDLGLPLAPVGDLKEILHRCGWPVPDRQIKVVDGSRHINAFVAKSRREAPLIVGPALGPQSDRFRLARTLFFVPPSADAASPRLVTNAFSWDQRASRAFAAELLAPAEALRHRLANIVSREDVDLLAQEFDVHPKLVEHQIRNHRLAWLEND